MENYKEIKLSGKSTNFNWIKSKFDEGILHINGGLIHTEDDFNLLRTAIRVTNDVYEGAWDLDIDIATSGMINIQGIVIHFPLINITNRDGLSHNIKNLFVRQPLRLAFGESGNKRLKIDRLEGGRTTLSYAEYCSDYFHSHLSIATYNRDFTRDGHKIPFYSTFCTGSGEINIYQSNINVDGFTEEAFMQYLLQIITLVGYESIEGTPYRHIKNILVKTRDNNYYRVPGDSDKMNLFHRIKENHIFESKLPDINFVIEGSRYIIIDDDKWEEFLKSGVVTELQKKRWFVMQDAANNVYPYETGGILNYVQPIIPNDKYIFRGQEYSYIVENIPDENEIVKQEVIYHIHPEVRKSIKNKVENDIDKYKIRKSTIDRYEDKSSNARESITTN